MQRPTIVRIVWPALGVLLAIVLMGSLAANVYLFQQVMRDYKAQARLRLDPTAERRFVPQNERLAARGASPRLILFGDSRAEQWNPTPRLDGWNIVNRGRGGETTAQSLLRLQRDVLALQPDIVILQTGINDLKEIGALPDEAGSIEQSCVRNMRSLVDQLLEANIQVVLLTIFPVGETPVEKLVVWSDKTIEAVDRINELWRRTKRRGLVVVDCDKLLCQPQGRRIRAEFARDHLHVNQRGYALLNRDIEPILSSLGKEPRRAVQ